MSKSLGEERRLVKRALSDEERKEHERKARKTYDDQKEAQELYQAFAKYAEPRIRRTLDPSYSGGDEESKGAPEITFEQARDLQAQLNFRRSLKGATVGKLKADRQVHLDAAALGYVYELRLVDLVADLDRLTVKFIDSESGEVVDERGMTTDERQMHLPNTAAAANDGAVDDEAPKKSRKRKNGAPDAIA